jgi:general secretion pathway protein L
MAASSDAMARPRPAWRQKVSSFRAWWMGELVHAMPERLRGAGRVPQLQLGDGELVLVEPKSAAGPDSNVALATLDAARARQAVRALLERAGESRNRARLCLGRDEALMRRVSMPGATEENLRQVLGFEMDRLTPFKAEDVYFDARVVGRDAAAGTISVLLAIARRELVDARLAALRDLGVSVQGVTLREEPGQSNTPLDLLPLDQRGERETTRERIIKRGLLAAVVALLLFALLFPVWRKRDSIIKLHPVVGKAQADAQATDTLAHDLERQVADYNFLLAKKHAAPASLAYLEEVTRLLPDNTWVQQFELKTAGKTREVQITGETASSSKLIEILEKSTLLQNAATRGTVTTGSQPNSQRFMIAAETRPRPMPESVSLAGSPVPVAVPAAPPAPAPAPAPAPQPAKVEPVKPPAKPAAAPGK